MPRPGSRRSWTFARPASTPWKVAQRSLWIPPSVDWYRPMKISTAEENAKAKWADVEAQFQRPRQDGRREGAVLADQGAAVMRDLRAGGQIGDRQQRIAGRLDLAVHEDRVVTVERPGFLTPAAVIRANCA